jgi:hypothetical protein
MGTKLPTKLHIENSVITQVERATLSLWIGTENPVVTGKRLFGKPKYAYGYGSRHLKVSWHLMVVVDEDSGADAAACPWFDVDIDGKAFPSRLEELSGAKLADGEVHDFRATYGNDAPQLEKNSFEFGEWIDRDHVMVRWSAEYDWGWRRPEKIPFLFEGPVEFDNIEMSVKKEDDAVPFLSSALPALDQSQFTLEWGYETVHKTRELARDRRRWRQVLWRRKA